MTDDFQYIPVESQIYQARWRRIGTIFIGIIYASAAILVFFGPDAFRWPAISVAMFAPPTIEFFQPKISRVHGQSAGLNWFFGYVVLTILVGILAGLTLAPKSVAIIIYWILGAVATLASIILIVRWILAENASKRLLIILVILLCISLIAGIVFGPSMLRWICIGILASFLVAFFNPSQPVESRTREIRAARDVRARRRSPSDGAVDHHFFMNLIWSAARASERLIYSDMPDAADKHDDRVWDMHKDILEGIALLQHLCFISEDDAKRFRDGLTKELSTEKNNRTVQDNYFLKSLLQEFQYSIARLRVHELGNLDIDFYRDIVRTR